MKARNYILCFHSWSLSVVDYPDDIAGRVVVLDGSSGIVACLKMAPHADQGVESDEAAIFVIVVVGFTIIALHGVESAIDKFLADMNWKDCTDFRRECVRTGSNSLQMLSACKSSKKNAI